MAGAGTKIPQLRGHSGRHDDLDARQQSESFASFVYSWIHYCVLSVAF
jgi:hypothetical protein